MITLKNPTFGSRGLLPDGYVQLHWIESSGNQKIDTLIPANSGYTFVTRMMFTSWISDTSQISGRYNSNRLFFAFVNTSNYWGYGYGSNNMSSTSASLNTWYEIESHLETSSQSLKVNGTTVASGSSSTSYSLGSTFWLFGNNDSGSLGGAIKGKMCETKFYQGETLVFDGIPCINPQNEVGMYDLVSQTFFGNSGTGVFIAGARVVDLPLGYTQVEYIQSTGTQLIDTGYVADENTGVVLDFMFDTGSAGACMLCAGNTYRVEYYNSPYLVQMLYYNGSSTDTQIKIGLSVGTRYSFIMNDSSHNWYYNETLAKTVAPTKKDSTNINLFAYSSSSSRKASGKIYGCQINQSGTLIRDFIPCISSTNEVGMYDLVSEQFFGNAGSGTFTAGSPVLPLYLYNEGDECEVTTNGWTMYRGTVNRLDDRFEIVATSISSVIRTTSSNIYITGYKKLKALGKSDSTNSCYVALNTSGGQKYVYLPTSEGEATVDISSASGVAEGEIGAGMSNGSGYIKRMWLEP